jgi:hypothetical protein
MLFFQKMLSKLNYGFLVGDAAGGAVLPFGAVEFATGVVGCVALALPLAIGAATVGATVGAVVIVFVLAGLAFVLLVAASPQAIPRAPRLKTAESKITFFILLKTPAYLSQRIYPVSRARLILHSRFCHELFLFQGKRHYRNTQSDSQP